MTISIDLYEVRDGSGRVCAADARATILYSPREGYSAIELAALESDLGGFINERLRDAMKEGGAK